MPKQVTTLLLLLFACHSHGQTSAQSYPAIPKAGQKYRDFIPSGWDTLATAKGDLNKDNIADLALIIERKPAKKKANDDDMPEAQPRMLLVLFQQTDGLKLACQSNKAILLADEGGMMGDPFQSIAIRRGTIVTDFFGGSREKWSVTYIYRFQKGDFYLIGATNAADVAEYTEKFDYNLSTGQLNIEKIYDQSPNKNKKSQKIVKQAQLPLLKSFEPWSLKVSDKISF
jgi:hypothetical protein